METTYENVKPSDNNVNDNAQEVTQERVDVPLTQLELIKQWRTTLACLIEDVKFDNTRLSEDEKVIAIRECIEYLDKKNTLLDDHDDFQLSDAGFSKYKEKHMQVFDYLSSLPKVEKTKIKSTFYLVDIAKHFEQQLVANKWTHFLMHCLLIPLVCIAFLAVGAGLVVQTQHNMVVYILFLLYIISQFRVIPELLKKVKKTVPTPFKFKVSLLAIHLLNTFKKFFWICLFPILLIKRVYPFWIDDVIIISLFIFYVLMFKTNDISEQEVSGQSSTKEVDNV